MADETPKLEEVKPEPAVKPGKKSSEHLMTYVAMGLSVLVGIVAELGLPESHWAVKGIAMLVPIVGSTAYTFSRSGVKKAEAAAKK
jgi:hypothetical protein